MAIDRARLRQYLREVQALQDRVSDPVFMDIVREKLLDMISRGELDTEELEFILREVDRFFSPDFSKFHLEVKDTYNDTLEVVNDLYDDLGEDISREFSMVREVEKTNDLQIGEYQEKTKEAIARTVRDGIKEDKSVKELERDLRELGGKAEDYAETLAGTHIKRYGRVSKRNKSLQAEVEIYEYAGVLRDTTRPFCRACLHKLFRLDDILNMENGNLEPVIENCGGWNCIHDWEPDPTASEADAVSGKLYTVPGGAKLFGDEGIAKEFSYSVGLDSLVNRTGVQEYITKTKNVEIKQDRMDHIMKNYPDRTEHGIKTRIGQMRSNPDNVFYQYNKGPRIVYEKDGEYLFASARKVHTMFKPADHEKFKEEFADHYVPLRNYE